MRFNKYYYFRKHFDIYHLQKDTLYSNTTQVKPSNLNRYIFALVSLTPT